MTRKDFELIAAVIRDSHLAKVDKHMLAQQFATELRRTNERFDVGRFRDACTGN